LPATASARLCRDGKAGGRERLEITARGLHRDFEFLGQLGRGDPAANLQEEEGRHQPITAHADSMPRTLVTG
jgi:hypothetical protein